MKFEVQTFPADENNTMQVFQVTITEANPNSPYCGSLVSFKNELLHFLQHLSADQSHTYPRPWEVQYLQKRLEQYEHSHKTPMQQLEVLLNYNDPED